MNESERRALKIGDEEIDELLDYVAHYESLRSGQISASTLHKLANIILELRETIAELIKQRSKDFEAGRDHYFSDKSGEMEVYFKHRSFAEYLKSERKQ